MRDCFLCVFDFCLPFFLQFLHFFSSFSIVCMQVILIVVAFIGRPPKWGRKSPPTPPHRVIAANQRFSHKKRPFSTFCKRVISWPHKLALFIHFEKRVEILANLRNWVAGAGRLGPWGRASAASPLHKKMPIFHQLDLNHLIIAIFLHFSAILTNGLKFCWCRAGGPWGRASAASRWPWVAPASIAASSTA